MAENKRQEWEIERDRAEIASLLARFRRISHQSISDILNRRRRDEFKAAMATATDDLGPDDPIPNVPPPYELSRQMITYEVKNLKREFRKHANEKFEVARGIQLNEIDELAKTAWEGYDRSMTFHNAVTQRTSEVKLKGVAGDPDLEGLRSVEVPGIKTVSTKKREQLIGDPRFLLVVDRTLERRERLLGLITEELNVNVQPTDVKLVVGFNPEEWDKADTQPRDDNSNNESETPAT